MTTLLNILERLLDGETDADAIQLVAEYGLPAMMLRAYESGLLEEPHWQTWKARMDVTDAHIVLGNSETQEWPHEVQEWATIIAICNL